MRRFVTLTLSVILAGSTAILCAQQPEMKCDDHGSDKPSFCEIKEFTLASTGRLTVDGGGNGGIHVTGWDRGNVLVRAKIQARAESDADARSLAAQVQVSTAGSIVHASGPNSLRHASWSVSYEVFVPHQTALTAKTHNGGISIADISGQIEFQAANGGVKLRRLAGTVHGATTNGGLSVELAGTKWDGEGMDVATTNGGVTVKVPENYSARLEVGTTNGGIAVGFPITVSGNLRVRNNLSTTLGSGGALIQIKTTNGGVSLSRA